MVNAIFPCNIPPAFVCSNGVRVCAWARAVRRQAFDVRSDAVLRNHLEHVRLALELALSMSALYALVILYRASGDLIARQRISAKFAAVKSLIVISNLQKVCVTAVLLHTDHETDGVRFCLSPSAHAAWVQYFLLLLEAPALAILHREAYPAKHLYPDHLESPEDGLRHTPGACSTIEEAGGGADAPPRAAQTPPAAPGGAPSGDASVQAASTRAASRAASRRDTSREATKPPLLQHGEVRSDEQADSPGGVQQTRL